MAIHVALSHITHYRYDRLVKLGPQVVRLRPAPHSRTKVLSYSQRIEPEGHFINWQQDPFANYQARLVFPEPTTEFKVTIDLVVEMAVYNPFDFFLEPRAENFPFSYDEEQKKELAPYLVTAPVTPLLKAYLATVDRSERRTIDFLVDVNQKLQHAICVHHPHGAGCAGARRNAQARQRLLPRHRLAAGADPAPHGPGRALRVGLPDPAQVAT